MTGVLCDVHQQCTLLGTNKEMHQKNIDAIKILLDIAHTEGRAELSSIVATKHQLNVFHFVGNHLKDSWGDVLQCISELERLHMIGQGLRPKVLVFHTVLVVRLTEVPAFALTANGPIPV